MECVQPERLFPSVSSRVQARQQQSSNWQGPLWGISNYMVWCGLVDYGLNKEARMMAEKTVALFGEDLKKNGALHEYYDPDTGEPIMNPGFQNWNYLVLNMVAWQEGRNVIREF